MKILEKLKFKKKKAVEGEKKIEAAKEPSKSSELKIFCGDDHEVYEALEGTLSLAILGFPKDFSMEETLKKAREQEESGGLYSAGLEYRTAGQISLFNGDVEGVKKFFAEAQRLTGREYSILKIPERAIKVAQEYYQAQAGKARQTK